MERASEREPPAPAVIGHAQARSADVTRGCLLVRHLGAVGRAAALALAGVLAFAAVVAGLAAALALAGVLGPYRRAFP